MALDIEAVQAALYARLTGSITGLKSTTRILIGYDALSSAQKPAMVVVSERAQAHNDNVHAQLWTLTAIVVFYVQVEQGVVPETALFGFIKQAETALGHQNNEPWLDAKAATSLGGLVRYARIRDHEIHHGAGTRLAAATLTIEMLALE